MKETSRLSPGSEITDAGAGGKHWRCVYGWSNLKCWDALCILHWQCDADAAGGGDVAHLSPPGCKPCASFISPLVGCTPEMKAATQHCIQAGEMPGTGG